MDRVTRIDLPGRLWKATREKSAEIDQQLPCFVAGPENRLVAVAMESLLHADPRVIDSREATNPQPGKNQQPPKHPQWNSSQTLAFSPLILLGASGCGKSHLARGIANHWHTVLSAHTTHARLSQTRNSIHPLTSQQTSFCDLLNSQTGLYESRQVAYLSSSDFGRMYRQAREHNKLADLRWAIDHLRLFVLEELHLMRLSRIIQQELRFAIDRLLISGAMVLATSQQPLSMITALEGGLRDRLSAGLTVRIAPPGHAARLELLQLAADQRGTKLDLNSAQHLSQQVEGSAPQLFQALVRLEHQRAQASSMRGNFTGSSSTVLNRHDEPSHEALYLNKHVTIHQIIAVVARYFSVSQAHLRGNSRRRSIVHARGVAVYLARILTELSYAQIGHHLGNRDHTTTLHANRKLKQLLATDAFTQECVENLKRILTVS